MAYVQKIALVSGDHDPKSHKSAFSSMIQKGEQASCIVLNQEINAQEEETRPLPPKRALPLSVYFYSPTCLQSLNGGRNCLLEEFILPGMHFRVADRALAAFVMSQFV